MFLGLNPVSQFGGKTVTLQIGGALDTPAVVRHGNAVVMTDSPCGFGGSSSPLQHAPGLLIKISDLN